MFFVLNHSDINAVAGAVVKVENQHIIPCPTIEEMMVLYKAG
jgi:hypothetical protein